LLRAAIHRTPMRGGMRGNACISFGVSPDALMDLWMRRLNEHGVRSFWIYDVLYGIEKWARLARVAKEYGSEVVGTVFYTISPVHTDSYLAAKAAEIAAVPEIDGVLFYDTAGVLEVERLRTLLPKIVAAAAPKPVEIHANNLMGTSGLTYVEAVRHGVTVLHTASRSMANGPSTPSTESVVRNLELMGIEHSLDTSLLPPVSEHFRRVGRAAGHLVDQVSEYDLFNVTHQVPGGMIGTLKAQLAQHGMTHRLDEVLAETGRVREELGWPVMATPLSQLVGTQAVLNVVSASRYELVPDEVVAYAAGHYGEPPAPIASEAMERIMGAENAERVVADPPGQPTLEELRARHGTGPGEDDLLILRALIPEHDIEAMRAAGPVRRDFPLPSPEVEEIRTLISTVQTPYVRVATERWAIELNR
ncbi:MAG: oxaloacetate decarboxylase (Na+ extruding) subunit alpha, partial [Gaiellaceae bacterium]|nr:oxaloacetate decarboxylase (Na+ extruding) subunit alpha [Gaiellaceae bacterium]